MYILKVTVSLENLIVHTVLVTVTNLDVTLHGATAENLANRWAEMIDSRLLQALQERQPEYLYRFS